MDRKSKVTACLGLAVALTGAAWAFQQTVPGITFLHTVTAPLVSPPPPVPTVMQFQEIVLSSTWWSISGRVKPRLSGLPHIRSAARQSWRRLTRAIRAQSSQLRPASAGPRASRIPADSQYEEARQL